MLLVGVRLLGFFRASLKVVLHGELSSLVNLSWYTHGIIVIPIRGDRTCALVERDTILSVLCVERIQTDGYSRWDFRAGVVGK